MANPAYFPSDVDMKQWHKLALSISVGVLLGFLLPLSGGDTQTFLKILCDLLISIGTYILIPLMFSQVALASAELVGSSLGRKFIARSLVMLVGSSFLFSLIGGLAVLVLPVDRIPIIVEESSLKDIPGIDTILQNIFSPNAFQVLSGSVQFIPGIFVFALIFGLGIFLQRNNIKVLVDVLEASARVFSSLNRYVVEILVYGTAILLCARIVAIRQTPDIELFLRLFGVLGILTLFLLFVIYPIVLRILGIRQKPLAWFRHTLVPLLVALCSGANYLALGPQMKIGIDNLRYPRRVWAWFYPLAAIIGRAGSTMVISTSFFLVLRSYSKLEIPIDQFFFIVTASVVLGALPNGRILICLALLASWFGQGIEEGYFIIQPVVPILVSIAAVIDVINQSFLAFVLNQLSIKESSGIPRDHSSKLHDEFNIS